MLVYKWGLAFLKIRPLRSAKGEFHIANSLGFRKDMEAPLGVCHPKEPSRAVLGRNRETGAFVLGDKERLGRTPRTTGGGAEDQRGGTADTHA